MCFALLPGVFEMGDPLFHSHRQAIPNCTVTISGAIRSHAGARLAWARRSFGRRAVGGLTVRRAICP